MKPQRIILIRHGQSEANIDRAVRGHIPDYATKLTATGIAEAEEAGEKLRSTLGNESVFFYISPYWRTRMTFEEIAKQLGENEITWREEPRLREQEWGHLRTEDEAVKFDQERDSFGTFYYRLRDGESAADVYDRVSDFFGTLHREFEKENFPNNVVIVTHGMTIRVFLMRWFHWTVEEFEEFANPKNCQIITLEKNDAGRYTLTKPLEKHKVSHQYQRPTVFKKAVL